MKFRDILKECDELYPNSFTDEEKMNFANDIGAMISRKYIKKIKTYTADGGDNFSLPAGVTYDTVTEIKFDGKLQTGISVAAVLENSSGHNVEVKYIDVPVYGIDDEVPLGKPHHNIYVYYVLSFICLHSGDTDCYNSNLMMYNTYLNEYEKSLSSFEGETIRYKNLW